MSMKSTVVIDVACEASRIGLGRSLEEGQGVNRSVDVASDGASVRTVSRSLRMEGQRRRLSRLKVKLGGAPSTLKLSPLRFRSCTDGSGCPHAAMQLDKQGSLCCRLAGAGLVL